MCDGLWASKACMQPPVLASLLAGPMPAQTDHPAARSNNRLPAS
jgi:hypothetical protein